MGSRSCRACGLVLRDGARFCDGCGARTPGPDVAEYKQVTVMFADVVRSMDIAEQVGAERLREIMAELVARSAGVVRLYGGVVNQFTGDGLMAVFGMPQALEDHAPRACLAALRIHDEARSLDSDVQARDGVRLQLRIGLNSGRVIVGEIGSGAPGYTTIGEQVGLAQRMESVAPVGGVMLSAATARLVEHCALLGAAESVSIKNRDIPVAVRQLLAVQTDHSLQPGRWETDLVGRAAEIGALAAALEQSLAGRGSVTEIVGPAGIGKTRIVSEASRLAAARSIPTYSTFCESHTRDVPFRAAARLLRAAFAIRDLEPGAARARVRSAMPNTDPDNVLLLDDLLGIGDPAAALPNVTPEARHRRLAALMTTAMLARQTPVLYVIEDAHWIDEASESLLAELIDAIPEARSVALITYRPEYRGALAGIPAANPVALTPLSDRHTATLATELLGTDPSVQRLASEIVEKAAGNPLFVSEIVRDLAEQGVLEGERGQYRCHVVRADIAVPPTLQAAIAARIDRLGRPAKSVLYAGAVLGTRFGPDLLGTVLVDSGHLPEAIKELSEAELVEQVASVPSVEFAFRHPLIRAVAYESQLKAARNEMHRRVAAAIESAGAGSTEQNAALIAGHLQAAGELRAAFDWHMRAGRWLVHRDRPAAWVSWQRAREVAERLPAGDPARPALQTTVLTRLCSEVWKTGGNLEEAGFEQLRRLCGESGDERSLAIGLAGMVMALTGQHRHREAADLIPELLARIESIQDPTVSCGLLLAVTYAKSEVGELREALRLAQIVIDLADGDLAMGNVLFGSPLASATRMRGLYRLCLGVVGWRSDADAAVAMAEALDPTSRVSSVMYKYILSIPVGARRVDERALHETAEALQIAEQAADELTLTTAQVARGLVLEYGNHPGQEGVDLLSQARDTAVRRRFTMNAMSLTDPALARHRGRTGDVDGAIEMARNAIAEMSRAGEVLSMGVATSVLVESLLKRSAEGDQAEALVAVDRLAAIRADPGFVLHELPLLKLRALIAEARNDDTARGEFMARARRCAAAAGFELPDSAADMFTGQRR